MKAIINIDLTKKHKDGKPEIDSFIWTEDREPPLVWPRIFETVTYGGTLGSSPGRLLRVGIPSPPRSS